MTTDVYIAAKEKTAKHAFFPFQRYETIRPRQELFVERRTNRNIKKILLNSYKNKKTMQNSIEVIVETKIHNKKIRN